MAQGTWVSGGLDSSGGTAGLDDLKGFFQPDSMIWGCGRRKDWGLSMGAGEEES